MAFQIREGGSSGTLLGHYCGAQAANITGLSANTLWVRFRSDADGTAAGLLADYTYGTSNDSSRLSRSNPAINCIDYSPAYYYVVLFIRWCSMAIL